VLDFKSIFAYGVGSSLQAVVIFSFSILISRVYTSHEFFLWGVYSATFLMLSNLICGASVTLLLKQNTYKKAYELFLFSSLIFAPFIFFVLLIFILILNIFIDFQNFLILSITSLISSFGYSILTICLTFLRRNEKIKNYLAVSAFFYMSYALIVATLTFNGFSFYSLIITSSFLLFITSFIIFIYLRYYAFPLHLSLGDFSSDTLGKYSTYGYVVPIHMAMASSFFLLDKYILSFYWPSEMLALYQSTFTLGSIMMVIVNAITLNWTPQSYSLLRKVEYLDYLQLRLKYTFLIFISGIILTFFSFYVGSMLLPNYLTQNLFLLDVFIVVFSFAFIAIIRMNNSFLFFNNLPWRVFINSLLVMLLICLNVFLFVEYFNITFVLASILITLFISASILHSHVSFKLSKE
jgi:O-antigen/teichoic acid export membrane protein